MDSDNNQCLDLVVIVPVYNEEGAIPKVLDEWRNMLGSLGINYVIAAYNDGSRDKTEEILETYKKDYPENLHVINKKNSGHGPTILRGYRDYVDQCEWLFQMDSDNEMGPMTFPDLWKERNGYDFLLGKRDGRTQPLPRKVISFVSRMVVRLFYGRSVWDVNAPYRLMRSSAFRDLFHKIPDNTFAPNVIISGYVGKKRLRFAQFDVPHTNRQTGEVSIKKWKLLKSAARSFFQTVLFSFRCN